MPGSGYFCLVTGGGWGIAHCSLIQYDDIMVTMTVKLPPATSAKLSAEAKARRITKSQIVRELLDKHYKSNGKKKRRPTFAELAGDLIGVFDGPGDLSTNPKYMEGYGE